MNGKFLVVLLATIFYNGVIHASVDGQRASDVGPPEEKPPTYDANKTTKLEPIPTSAAPSVSVPVRQNLTAAQKETVHKDPQSAPEMVNVTDAIQTVAAAAAPPSEANKSTATIVTESNTANQTTEGKIAKQTIDGKNAVQPAAASSEKNDTTVIPTGKHGAELPVPAQMSTVSPTPAVTTPVPTTKKAPTTKLTVSTVAPVAITKDSSVIAEQNTPAAPVQEKHFDGPSFFGGIVLTIGLTAIGFIAFKYYKSGKIDMNYRTL